jgi:hypothetical protein
METVATEFVVQRDGHPHLPFLHEAADSLGVQGIVVDQAFDAGGASSIL